MATCNKEEETLDLITCAVCLIEFDDDKQRAKFLTCFHTFCSECLKEIFDSTKKYVMCPTCRHLTACQNGIDGLPNNSYASHIARLKNADPPSVVASTISPSLQQNYWCLLCCSASKQACKQSSSHTAIPFGTSTLKEAQELNLLFNISKERQAMTATKLKQVQAHLNSTLMALKIVEDQIKSDMELNDVKLAEIASSLDHPDILGHQHDTVTSLKPKVAEMARRSHNELCKVEKSMAELESESKTRFIIQLQDASTNSSISTIPLFYDGFVLSDIESSDSVKRPLSVLSHIVYSILNEKNVSILPLGSQATSDVIEPSVFEPAKNHKSSAGNIPKTAAISTSTIPRGMQSGSSFVIGQSIFTFKFQYLGKMIGGEVRVVPTPAFDNILLMKLGNACFRKPTNYVTDLTKAFPNGFIKMGFTSRFFADQISGYRLPENQRAANQVFEVGVSAASLNGVSHSLHSIDFLFLLHQFQGRYNETPIHFGKIVHGHQVLRDLSLQRRSEREGITTIIEAV